jgi:hypothetical protein
MVNGRVQSKNIYRGEREDNDDASLEYTDSEDQFVPRDGDEDDLWEVIEIVAEKGKRYRVRWAGINPQTNKPWPLDWVPKSDCTPDIVKAWKQKQAQKKTKKGRRKGKGTRAAQASSVTRKGKEKAEDGSDCENQVEDTRKSRVTLRRRVAPESIEAGK